MPGNIALAINPEIIYIEVEVDGDNLIVAKDRALKVLKENYKTIKEFKGSELVGQNYEPLYEASDFVDILDKDYKVYSADFVSSDEGTGIVHIAPSFGVDDMNLQNKEKFSMPMTVSLEGKMLTKIAKDKFVKDADLEIIEDLKKKKLFFLDEEIEHEYPFCWRCESILIYYAKSSWFISVSKARDQLLKNNKDINWVPAYIKEGRFGEWLKGANDWALSRERYWGTPLPIWKHQIGKSVDDAISEQSSILNPKLMPKSETNLNDQNSKCEDIKIIGSIKELQELSIKPIDIKTLDLHKPFIDDIEINCDKCGGKMTRVPEVIDVWFDSGAMPFASGEYPDNFPADYICEAIDQTRGWFYTMLTISTLLDKGTSYKNVISLAHVLDEKGKKMSKSKGNVIDPMEVIDKFGTDSLRWYFYTVNSPGDSKRMSKRSVEISLRQFIMLINNIYSFFVSYANIDGWNLEKQKQSDNILDKWVLAKFNQVLINVTKDLEKYNITTAARTIHEFVNDLSTWYLRRSRKRRDNEFYSTLYFVLINTAKMIAPFTPFTAESIYQNLKTGKDPESVHLCDFPKAEEYDNKLIDEMQFVKNTVEIGHSIRTEAGIKVRQPLGHGIASTQQPIDVPDWSVPIIQEELNVKEFSWVTGNKESALLFKKENKNYQYKEKNNIDVYLDTKITPELKNEGILRDILRSIQNLRKKAGLLPGDLANIYCYDNTEIVKKNLENIQKNTAVKIEFQKKPVDIEEDLKIDDQKIWLGVMKAKRNEKI